MSRQPRIVAWTSTEEYLSVAEYLYSASIDERKHGVAIVKAWRSRARIPVAIEATAGLVEMTVADEEAKGVTTNHLRHMYSMAMIRFVNTIVDLEQKGTFAQSVVSLAGKIGMPAWFVELRHAATHEQLPSLTVLQSACQQALGWLSDYYWNKQTRSLPSDTQVHIRNALAAYLQAQDIVLQQGGRKSGKKGAVDYTAMETASAELTRLVENLHVDAVRELLIPLLLEPGFLVPEDKKLRSKFPECKLLPGVEKRWKDLLVWFAECWGETTFYDELLAGIVAGIIPNAAEAGLFEVSDSVPSLSHAATLVAWVRWIVESYYVPEGADLAGSPAISIEPLLESCLRNPSYYSRSILKIVSETDAALKRDLKPFVDFMTKALEALAAMEADKKTHAGSKPARVMSEEAMKQEEALMVQRLNAHFGSSAAVDESLNDDGAPEADGASMDVDAPAARQPAGSEAAACRWKRIPEPGWAACPIGTLASGDVPSLEWPAWVDDLPLYAVPA
ncbi:rRNA-processing protein las1 [Coemansia interrupta]|uniref:rRNA-processing protein las1 n=1 Tax=Coemansia interrupta TaxID=1126814 RepID=A0A9W8LNB3_9FUNG|nr:rRNA-processing protein las1 [Coemansia interrupta]